MIIDTHAHYDDERFDDDRDKAIIEANKQGISCIINAAQNLATSKKCIELTEKFSFVYCSVGIHPHNADECNDLVMEELSQLAKNPKVVAIGETGLDYHYDFSPRESQKKNLIDNIILAKKIKKPLIIHDREAHEDIINILKAEKIWEVGGVVHCFTGSVEMAKQIIDMGLYISIGGAVTFKNANKVLEVVKYVPEDRLLLETDCPYMTPEPYRGKRNESFFIKYTAKRISELKNRKIEEVYQFTTANTLQLFPISLK